MATDITHTQFTSAMSSQLAFHPAVEPRRSPPPSSSISSRTNADETPVLGKKEIQHAVVQMNELAKVMNHRLSFSLDDETHDIIVKVIDADTDKVIRELPAAELQKLHKSIKEAVGLLIDKLI